MEKLKTCCFTGSRPQKLSFGFNEQHPDCLRLKALITEQIETLIVERGVTHFITGMALGVDQWAAEAVLELKKKYPHITLESAIPCEEQAKGWTVEQRERYYTLASLCDKETMLQRAYTQDCMQKRNRYMVDSSEIILAVWSGKNGGTASTIKYAQQQGKEIVCINTGSLLVTKLN